MANGAKTNLQEDVLAGFRVGLARVSLQIAGAAGHRTFRSARLHLAEGLHSHVIVSLLVFGANA